MAGSPATVVNPEARVPKTDGIASPGSVPAMLTGNSDGVRSNTIMPTAPAFCAFRAFDVMARTAHSHVMRNRACKPDVRAPDSIDTLAGFIRVLTVL